MSVVLAVIDRVVPWIAVISAAIVVGICLWRR
jgi:hypothetical protein